MKATQSGNQNLDLLQQIYDNALTGQHAISAMTCRADSGFCAELETQKNEYGRIAGSAQQYAQAGGQQLRGIGKFQCLGITVGTKIGAISQNTSHLAEMVIEGSNMGIIDITRCKKRCAEASDAAKNLAEHLLTFEQQSIERMKEYL